MSEPAGDDYEGGDGGREEEVDVGEREGTGFEGEEGYGGEEEEEEEADKAEEEGNDEEEGGGAGVDEELEEMKRKVQEMENEAAKLKAMQQELQNEAAGDAKNTSDETSIYVGQVDYDATPEELQAHFAQCGTINRVTILCDKFTGKSKGYAYVEFEDKDSVANAVQLDNTIFKGRQLKVSAKRTNVPGRGGRGRGRFSRGRGRGFYRGYGYRGGYHRGRSRGYRPY